MGVRIPKGAAWKWKAVFSHLCINSITRMVHSENSTAIDRVAATRSKSDEFSECTILVIEIVSLLCLKPPKWCCTFWDPDSLPICASLVWRFQNFEGPYLHNWDDPQQKLIGFWMDICCPIDYRWVPVVNNLGYLLSKFCRSNFWNRRKSDAHIGSATHQKARWCTTGFRVQNRPSIRGSRVKSLFRPPFLICTLFRPHGRNRIE